MDYCAEDETSEGTGETSGTAPVCSKAPPPKAPATYWEVIKAGDTVGIGEGKDSKGSDAKGKDSEGIDREGKDAREKDAKEKNGKGNDPEGGETLPNVEAVMEAEWIVYSSQTERGELGASESPRWVRPQ